MHIVLVSTARGHEMAFVEVGSFHYPLTPAIPCLHTRAGNYIFPLQEGVYYGISLPECVYMMMALTVVHSFLVFFSVRGIPEAYHAALDRVLTALTQFRLESAISTPQVDTSPPPAVCFSVR